MLEIRDVKLQGYRSVVPPNIISAMLQPLADLDQQKPATH
jgi:hypothetical protein